MTYNGSIMEKRQEKRETNVTERVNKIHTWLLTTGMDAQDQHNFIDGYCETLQEVGLPVNRFFCGASVLHPLVGGRAWKWMDGTITDFSWSRATMKRTQQRMKETPRGGPKKTDSPMFQLIEGAPFVRIRATDEILPEDVDWMKTDGYTELFGLSSHGTGHGRLEGGFTWSTKAEGGFTDAETEVLRETLLSLAAALRFQIMKSTSKTLLMTYLGEDAGSRVYGGEIDRGEGLVVRSVIFFSDIRGFTKMSEELSRTELVDVINSTFDVQAAIIKEHKGQVLKFMGDGIMAIFSSSSRSFQRASFSPDEKRELDEMEAAQMCHNARLAADAVQTRLEALKEEREAKGLRGVSVGIGLHYGDVSYGNVGASDRLDFTVLGSHVNVASRIESLCGKLGAKVLCTEEFYRLDGDAGAWRSRGDHEVKGVSHPLHVYELTDYLA